MTPRATYRLQFTADFGFADAAALAPYLAALGVSHLYASPVFAARPGSTHGYDVVDPTRLNPDLGDAGAFDAMVAALRAEGLGLILDIVPNHMGVGGAANRYWLSVLEWGQASPFAAWFDIDWASRHPGLAGKILVPFLGAQYGAVLADGGLELRFDRGEGSFAVWAHGSHKLPVCPHDYGTILRAGGLEDLAGDFDDAAGLAPGDAGWGTLRSALAAAPEPGVTRALEAFTGTRGAPETWTRLDALIARQHWRAAKFTLASDAINYRRFFTISDLAGVRVEDPEVFEATHALILRLVEAGKVDGLRVDHIDGLRDPGAYTRRLRARAARPIYLAVEKILAPDEALPAAWQADGTTGYEFANLVAGLLADPAGETQLSQTYADFTGRSEPPGELVHAAKLAVLDEAMAAERDAVVARLLDIANVTARYRDLGRAALRAGLVQVIAALDVYRTYADADGLRADDRPRIEAAVAEARRRNPGADPDVFDFLAAVMTLDLADAEPDCGPAVLEAVLRLQQLSGPVMAKGLEDNALYRFNRLIALNEVGSEPGHFGVSVDAFHRANAERLARTPAAMLGTATHDTKRGEDARARILAITGQPELWRERVFAWHDLLADPARPIDRNEEYFFYQLLLGVWPAEGIPSGAALGRLAQRVDAAMLKSAREAGVNTRWVFGDADYEAALSAFVARALRPGGDTPFLRSFGAFAAALTGDGVANCLIQAALKLTVPGVPDIYQGAELWDQSLVDPDNRRPVNFDRRAETLARIARGTDPPLARPGAEAMLALTAALLHRRAAAPGLFAEGTYEPLEVRGPVPGAICAFARRHDGERMLVAAAVHRSRAVRETWPETTICPPEGAPAGWRCLATGRTVGTLDAAALFEPAPLAILLPATT